MIWKNLLASYFYSDAYKKLKDTLDWERDHYIIYPERQEITRSLDITEYDEVKVVILGQDPYHGPNQANGLAFSVNQGQPLPPSLKNIYLELTNDLNQSIDLSGDLTCWAKQGVLLLNTTLTVRQGQAGSHQNLGWHIFTDKIIQLLSERQDPIVFILWGKHAQKKAKFIKPHHHIIASPHPSPLSAYRGFFGSKPFSRSNQLLKESGKSPIDWMCH